MNRIPILAGGAALAAVVLCGGAVTMANALAPTASSSQVLSISGVTTADPSAVPSTSPSTSPSDDPSAVPGDDHGGVQVVTPADPTKVDGRGCAHLGKHGADDPADHDATDDHGGAGDHAGDDGTNSGRGSNDSGPGSVNSGSQGGSDDSGSHGSDGGGHGGQDDGGSHH